MRKKKFPQEVARYFNPQKSGTNENAPDYIGPHQLEKRKEKRYITVYNGGGTAHKQVDDLGRVTYK